MKKIFGLLLLTALVACEEKDLSTENPDPNPDEKNVQLIPALRYGNEGLNIDSLKTNNFGNGFYLDEVTLVFSSTYFRELDDTIVESQDFIVIKHDSYEQQVLRLPAGGYSGHYGLRLGMDSARTFNFNPSTLPADSELKDVGAIRNDQHGIDQIIIKGRLLDPTNPLDTFGSIPLSFNIGTEVNSRLYESLQQHFSVVRDKNAKLIMQVDFEPLFESYDLFKYPIIISDPSVPQDMARAEGMANALAIGLF